MQPEAQLGLADLLGAGFTIIVIVIGLTYGIDLTTDIGDDFGADSCAARTDTMTSFNSTSRLCYNSSDVAAPDSVQWNATQDGTTAIAKIPKKLPMIVTIVIAGVVIGMLIRYLWVRMKEG